MYDTTVTIIGNALNAPELRQINGSGTNVANFRVASTSRRYDKDSGRWVDGPSLRVRVTCWRRLAEGVSRCVVTGDPLVVTGRMYTRDWVGEDGQNRVSYELEAVAVGHDLSRGTSEFTRYRANTTTTVVEDAESDIRIRGELTEPVRTPSEQPREFGDESYGEPGVGFGGGFGRGERAGESSDLDEEPSDERVAVTADDAAEVFRAAGLAPASLDAEPSGAQPDDDPKPATRRGRARVPQPA
jgi:single-strand DNA-binding protein